MKGIKEKGGFSMELKLTTPRALEYEKRTGKDIIEFLKTISQTNSIRVQDVVDLFIAMGDGYTVKEFDEWDASFNEKIIAIIGAIKEYTEGKK